MRLDHVTYAASPGGLTETVERLSDLLGREFTDGGCHPRFGTRNRVMPLARGHYLEVVEVLDHPAASRVPFAQAVARRTAQGGGWMAWVVEVDDLTPYEQRLGRAAIRGNRVRLDGTELRWRQIGVKGLLCDPQLPFFMHWDSSPEQHPSVGATGAYDLLRVEIAGDRSRVAAWLGTDATEAFGDIQLSWTDPDGAPGLRAVDFLTPDGVVTLL